MLRGGRPSGADMLRVFLFGALVAITVLILLWDSQSTRARVAKGASLAYIVLVAVLLLLGIAL